ncbi:MAG: hypothetical protein JWP97_4584 [Labilithrix sp.]|nr:hypothetical protein [Labilithrix sp.]
MASRWLLPLLLGIRIAPLACSKAEPPAPPDAARDAAPREDASAADAASDPTFPLPAPTSRLAPTPSAAPLPPSAWTWKVHQGDSFSILFPGEPKVQQLPADDTRLGFSQAVLEMPGGQVSFAAGYTDHTEDDVKEPELFLDGRVERANQSRRGTSEILTKRTVKLGGHPGRVVIQRRVLSGPALRVYSRMWLVGKRLFTLIVSTLDEGGIGEDVVKKFMESFKVAPG